MCKKGKGRYKFEIELPESVLDSSERGSEYLLFFFYNII